MSSSPQGQRSAPSRLSPPIMSLGSSPSPPSVTPALTKTLPEARPGPGLRAPITACQPASPNGGRCQSARWLKPKPRETSAPLLSSPFRLSLPFRPVWLLTPGSGHGWMDGWMSGTGQKINSAQSSHPPRCQKEMRRTPRKECAELETRVFKTEDRALKCTGAPTIPSGSKVKRLLSPSQAHLRF